MDVSLRVRMRYEAGDGATRATGDLEKVRATAERLGGATAGGERLNQGLRNTSVLAQSVQRDMQRVAAAATRLGAADGTARLAGGLKDAGQAAGATSRDLTQLSQVAARFGTVSTVSYLARDLKAVHAPAQALRTELTAVGKAAEGIGRSRGLTALEADLQAASRRADELDRRLSSVGRRGGGRGGAIGERGEFANEALRASGLGSAGLRFGMSGAAAGGLAVGAGIAATAGATALATREAISFEHAMTEVGKAIGSTSEGMRDLQAQFLAQSRKTGIRATEIAGIAAQGGYFNVPRDQIQGFTDVSAKAAVGFQMRPEETAAAFGPLMKAYKLKDVDELRLAGDAINTVGDSAGVRERNILDYLNRTSGIAGMSRIPLAKNAAIGGAIQSLGVAPDVAATGIGEVFNRLSNANLQGKDFQRGLRGIHMTGRQVKASMDQDAVGGFIDVLERINKLSDTKKPNVIRDMFGEGEVATVSRMAESVGVLREALERVSDPEKYRGSLEKTFKIFSSDTTASINRAGAALEGFATRLGQRFEPAVKASADVVARWLGGMTKALELADRAKALSEKQLQGKELSPKEKSELDANPKLKAETDRQVGIGREDAERRTIVEQEGRARARNAPAADPKAATPAAPREPDEQDVAAAQARERARIRLQGQIRDLDAEVEGRQRGGFETTADRLRLRKLRQQYERQFPEGDGGAQAVPGTGKRSDLQEGVKASLASYHEEVDRSLTRTERLAREMGRRIREDLEIKPKVQDAAFRFGGEDGARIERASLGGELLGGGGGGRFGGGGGGAGPGRFGGAMPGGGGGGARFGGARAGGGGGLTGRHIGTPGGSSAGPNLSEGAKARAMQYYAGLRAGGLDAVHANALMGHAMQETGGTFKGDSWNAKEGAGGMLQYRGNRLANLKRFAAEQGKDWTDPHVQGQFASAEQRMDPYEAKRAKSFMDATDVDTASREAGRNVVRFGDDTGPYRQRMARAFQDGSAYEGLSGPAGAAASRLSGRIKGFANLMHGQYGAPGENQVQIKTPSGKTTSVHSAAAESFSGFLKDLEATGYKIDSLGGLANRTQANGSGRISQHAYGNAIDINPSRNPYKTSITDMPSNVSEMAAKWGLSWGGDWSERSRDPMHFEWTGAQPWKNKDAPVPTAENKPAGMPFGLNGKRLEALERSRAERTAARSPRFMDPASYSLKPGAGGGDGAAGGGAARFGLGGPKVEQHFHTSADAHEVGRRAQLEQNREVRRTMAGALHDVGQPVSV